MEQVNVVKCINGHYFDSAKYPSCPICNAGAMGVSAGGIGQQQTGNAGFGYQQVGEYGNYGMDKGKGGKNSDSAKSKGGRKKTMGIFGMTGQNPVMDSNSGGFQMDNGPVNNMAGQTLSNQYAGGYGGNQVQGGYSNNQIAGGYGNNQVPGGYGNNQMAGGYGNNQMAGGYGNNQMAGGYGDNQFTGGFPNLQDSGGGDAGSMRQMSQPKEQGNSSAMNVPPFAGANSENGGGKTNNSQYDSKQKPKNYNSNSSGPNRVPSVDEVMNQRKDPNSSVSTTLMKMKENVSSSSEGKTMSYFGYALQNQNNIAGSEGEHANMGEKEKNIPEPVEPVVGWLVCLSGANVGRDYRICTGNNSIGRERSNRIVIQGDDTISRDKHAAIIFEPKHIQFFLKPGDSTGLTYLNGEYLSEQKLLNTGDIIDLGNTRLIFVPLCWEGFNWESMLNQSAQ